VAGGSLDVEAFDCVCDGALAGAELFDPLGRERDDGVCWVFVLLEAERLRAERAVDGDQLALQPLEVGLVLVPGR